MFCEVNLRNAHAQDAGDLSRRPLLERIQLECLITLGLNLLFDPFSSGGRDLSGDLWLTRLSQPGAGFNFFCILIFEIPKDRIVFVVMYILVYGDIVREHMCSDSRLFRHLSLMILVLPIVLASGCHRKPDVKGNLSQLEQAFPTATTTAPAQPVEPAPAAPAPGSDPNAYVGLALSAVRTNDYAGGVIALQTVQTMPGVTAQQLMAIESAKQALTADLVARADRGDTKAKAELAKIEKTHSQ